MASGRRPAYRWTVREQAGVVVEIVGSVNSLKSNEKESMSTAEIIALRNWLRDREHERNPPRHHEADRLGVLGDGVQGGEYVLRASRHDADE
jgi:hypothetical protein